MNIFYFNEDKIIPLLKKICNYCKLHEDVFDFSKTLPNGKPLFTLINPSKLNIQNIKEFINLIVENGANPNKQDEFGIYPLENAIKIGNYQLVVALININKIDYNQKIPTTKNKIVLNAPDETSGKNFNQNAYVFNFNQNVLPNNQNAFVNNNNQNGWGNNQNSCRNNQNALGNNSNQKDHRINNDATF